MTKMPAEAWACHQALLGLLMGSDRTETEKLGELLVLRSAVQSAINTIAEKIQQEHPGALV